MHRRGRGGLIAVKIWRGWVGGAATEFQKHPEPSTLQTSLASPGAASSSSERWRYGVCGLIYLNTQSPPGEPKEVC